ncbi:hypothetical protein SGCOL_006874 [Colletotrichum sp. CLE4]
MKVYGPVMEDIGSDCLVTWNWMGIILTTDYCLLEEAAGRSGVEAAKNAIPKIRIWTQTPAARRGCLHAAQAFRATSRRRTQDGGSFSASKNLFSAALVLALYLLTSPSEKNDNSGCANEFELLGNVDWKSLGTEGLSDKVDELSSSETVNAAADFIRLGGPVSMRNERCLGGLRSAQRVLLDFASLLDDMKKWRIGDYSRLLYMISEALTSIHGNGGPQSVAAIDGTETTIFGAMYLNGIAAGAFQVEHVVLNAHPSSSVLPALLVYASTSNTATTGEDFLTALAAGYEVCARIGLALGASVEDERGFHNPTINGRLAAAAAVGNLLDWDAEIIASAMGVAASSSGGLVAFQTTNAKTKQIHPGHDGPLGIEAALMARAGLGGTA